MRPAAMHHPGPPSQPLEQVGGRLRFRVLLVRGMPGPPRKFTGTHLNSIDAGMGRPILTYNAVGGCHPPHPLSILLKPSLRIVRPDISVKLIEKWNQDLLEDLLRPPQTTVQVDGAKHGFE